MFLLDTNVVSELRRARPHGAVLAWLRATDARLLHVSAVTFGELQRGVEITRDINPQRATELEGWIDRVRDDAQILPLDERCMRLWAKLMHKRSEHEIEDALIAATAITHRLVVATRNTRDFRSFDVELFDPFRYEAK